MGWPGDDLPMPVSVVSDGADYGTTVTINGQTVGNVISLKFEIGSPDDESRNRIGRLTLVVEGDDFEFHGPAVVVKEG